jgi:hypothetical protein
MDMPPPREVPVPLVMNETTGIVMEREGGQGRGTTNF